MRNAGYCVSHERRRDQYGGQVVSDQISRAAEAATKWWADRLQSGDAAKFAAILRPLIDADLRKRGECWTECDYDPRGHLLTAVRAAVDPECRGFGFSARGILPTKHHLRILPDRLEPKEGYGNWTDAIKIDSAAGNDTEGKA